MKIVADGPQRYRDACGYHAIRRQLVAAAKLRSENQWRAASLWGRMRITLRIECEVRRELKKIFPSGSLHVSAEHPVEQRRC